MVANLALITAQETIAAIVSADLALEACLFDEFHHLHELFVSELEVRVVGGASGGEHREKTPALDAQRDQVVA